jgi:hypothetical protein
MLNSKNIAVLALALALFVGGCAADAEQPSSGPEKQPDDPREGVPQPEDVQTGKVEVKPQPGFDNDTQMNIKQFNEHTTDADAGVFFECASYKMIKAEGQPAYQESINEFERQLSQGQEVESIQEHLIREGYTCSLNELGFFRR